MMRNLSSVDSYMLFPLVYEIILFIRNDLRHVLQNVNISDEHLLQLVSEAVVNNSERDEKLAQHKKDLKVNKIETDEAQDNPLLTELRKIQFEHSNQLAAFRSEILEIKQTLPRSTFQYEIKLHSNEIKMYLLFCLWIW